MVQSHLKPNMEPILKLNLGNYSQSDLVGDTSLSDEGALAVAALLQHNHALVELNLGSKY